MRKSLRFLGHKPNRHLRFNAFRQRDYSSENSPKPSNRFLWLATGLAGLYVAHQALELSGKGIDLCVWNNYFKTSGMDEKVFAHLETVVPKYLGKEFLEGPEWKQLKEEGQFEKFGNDAECRTPVVGTQSATEETFARMLEERGIDLKKGYELIVVIHTPLPTTPLTKGQVDLGIQRDSERMRATTLPRTYTLIDILEAGGTVIVYYLEGGLEKRPKEGQEFYKSLLKKYPDNLIDMPISKESMSELPSDQIGASDYVLKDCKIVDFFSIGAYQAIKEVKDIVPWSITHGNPDKAKVRAMIEHREALWNVKEMARFREKLMLDPPSTTLADAIEMANDMNNSI